MLLVGGTALLLVATLRIRGSAWFTLAALVLAAAAVVLAVILLSLADALTRGGLLAGHALEFVGAGLLWRHAGSPLVPRPRLGAPRRVWRSARSHGAVTVACALAAVTLALDFVLGLVVVPNNWDSMTYHLSRAAYWLQERSATQYPGASVRQTGSAPNAEMIQAWTMSLTGTDWIVELVQWTALLATGL